MYIYDTRHADNCKTLPLNGWFFPCIICEQITGQIKKHTIYRNIFYKTNFNIPFCNKCKKNNKKLPLLDELKIKLQYSD